MNVKGTYFYGLLSSGAWQPNSDGIYVIDRPNEGFDRILDCLSTGKLHCDGLTEYEIECVYDNLDYLLVPFTRVWDYSKVSDMDTNKLQVHLQLIDGGLSGSTKDNKICILYKDTSMIETTIEGHAKLICAIIQLRDGRICSCSDDYTIKVWNIESGHCDITIVGHTDFVFCVIQLIDGRICSGSYDQTLKIWNKNNEACELSINTMYCVSSVVQLRNGSICSGGYIRGNICIHNSTTGECETTLIGHTYGIPAITIDEKRICSCSDDKTIKYDWCMRKNFGRTYTLS